MIVCPSCGFEAADDCDFCSRCGRKLAAATTPAEERKTVTTLFCDLVGFTAMSESADPEDIDAVLSRYHAAARKVIESHGGTVEKFIGDAVVGVFGVPAVHEDDPERAVRAALRVLEALGGMVRPDGAPLQARCGVNTGEALVRLDIDPSSGRGFLTGDPVNTAARLQAAAPPGGVAVGTRTHELTRHAIVFEELPPVVAKGKARPVAAWLARMPISHTGLRTGRITTTPFLGRDDELMALRTTLRAASESAESRAILLVGDPGIGKSRLLLEFARTLDERPERITWRQGRCLPYGDGGTFSALGELVRAQAGIRDSDDSGAIEAKLDRMLPLHAEGAWLRQRLRPLLGLPTTQAERDENFAAWTSFLESIASAGAAVVVLEDLHWADDGMLAFVEHVVAERVKAPLLLVATARPELLQRPLGALIAADERVRRRTLSALPPDTAGALLAGLLGDDLAPDDAAKVVELVGGNPLYAEQYARLLLDGDHLTRTSDGLRLTEGAPLPIATTVQAVLAARLDSLPPELKALLCDAAVIGGTFWRGALTALSGRDASAVDVMLGVLLERDLVRPVVSPSLDGETEYQFWHALVRDVAYGQLPRKVRARKHEAAAQWIESAAGEPADVAEVLVHHYGAALELAHAAKDAPHAAALLAPTSRWLALAGERALRLDPRSAERHLTRALELVPPDSEEHLALLPRLAEALFLQNHLLEASELLEEAAAGFMAAGDTRAAAVAMCKLAHTLPRLGASDRGLTRAARDLLAGDGPSPEKAEVLAMHALSVSIENVDHEEVLRSASEAIAICEQLDLPEPALALHCRADARLMLGDLDGARDNDRAVAVARAQGLGRERATIELNRAVAILALDGPRTASRAALEGLTFARRHGLEAYVTNSRSALVGYLLEAGEWNRALDQAYEVLAQLEASEDAADPLYLKSLVARTLALRGSTDEIDFSVDSLTESGRERVGAYRGAALLAAALVKLSAGEGEAAAHLIEELLAAPPALLANGETLPTACRAALACGREDLAAPLLQCCLNGFPRPRLPLFEHVVTTIEALCAEADGGFLEAEAGFAEAATRWKGFEMPYEEAQALLGRGRCLVTVGRAQEAREPLTQAREIFARLGAKPALEETRRLLGSSS